MRRQAVEASEGEVEDARQFFGESLLEAVILVARPGALQEPDDERVGNRRARVAEPRQLVADDEEPRGQPAGDDCREQEGAAWSGPGRPSAASRARGMARGDG
jgi:hypothetical protein